MLFSFQCYVDTLNTMVTLQNQYMESKNEKNIFHRYNRLRSMVKVKALDILKDRKYEYTELVITIFVSNKSLATLKELKYKHFFPSY